ncbi:MAG: Asp-tRNA(Asn)/Glu-tRNA(Gln) amidotransferase subunit GatB [Clostridia bacterium]|nr:Asp-tRNA(Asn)/Glu-tRNA(Gln) amidotransferase subunit GatB [Clostridia bacterium]
MMNEYDIVIGLEIHAELKTNSKVFCSCENLFGSEPNTHCCTVCIGLPGALPVLNKKAVELAIKAGLCFGSKISPIAVFERKNYFYPDLSKAYQISQLEKPICVGGGVDLDRGKHIRLNRIHLEEDAGKLIHNENIGTFIDYNRGGIPLIETVTEPDISSADEAIEFLSKLRSALTFADIAECKMEEGGMRCDVNLSIKKKGDTKLGTRTEMKNLNSYKMVYRAIKYETDRQIEELEKGNRIKQETRKWDDNTGKSYAMRSKEESQDYRYFPDPDLLAVQIKKEDVAKIKKEIPMLPNERIQNYISLGLPEYDAKILTSEKFISNYFDNCISIYSEPKLISNWIMVELLKNLKETETNSLKDIIIEEKLCKIIKLVEDKKITRTIGKFLLEMAINTKEDIDSIIKKNNLIEDISEEEIEKIIKDTINNKPSLVEDFKREPGNIENFVIGQVMKNTRGKANIIVTKKIVGKYLNY